MSVLAEPLVEPHFLVADQAAVWRYAGAVARAVGVGIESVMVDQDSPVSAYVAVDVRSPAFPDRPLALVWSEDRGWSAVVESGSSLTAVSCLTSETPCPDPAVVKGFLDAVAQGALP